jgi:hypothetical protein
LNKPLFGPSRGRAGLGLSDAGDFVDRETFDEMKEQDRSLGERELVELLHELELLLAAQEQFERIHFTMSRLDGSLCTNSKAYAYKCNW